MAVTETRVAVKGGHGTSKTWSLADLAIWFLHCWSPAIVVTTAPSGEIVKNEIWRYMRRSRLDAKIPLLSGILPKEPLWDIGADRYAIGLATDRGDRFRGKHSPNMLFILDEANGLPSWAWEEADNMCTAPNNRIIASGNPIEPAGPFYNCFKAGSEWAPLTFSCLDHPNVLEDNDVYPGAVSRKWVETRVKNHSTPIGLADERQAGDFEWPLTSGVYHRPSPTFQARVLGEFPTEGPDTLISLASVARARKNAIPIDETTKVDIGMDVAYRGGDYCVVFARRGPSVIARRKWQGINPEKSKRELGAFIREFNFRGLKVGTVAVDAIGIGSGLAYGIQAAREEGDIQCDRVIPVQVSERANDPERYENKRAEIAYGLAERARQGDFDLTRLGEDADDFENQDTQIRRDFDQRFRHRLELKDRFKDRVGISPDDFDAMALCFIDTTDTYAEDYATVMSFE